MFVGENAYVEKPMKLGVLMVDQFFVFGKKG
jgi:hypothetical protein